MTLAVPRIAKFDCGLWRWRTDQLHNLELRANSNSECSKAKQTQSSQWFFEPSTIELTKQQPDHIIIVPTSSHSNPQFQRLVKNSNLLPFLSYYIVSISNGYCTYSFSFAHVQGFFPLTSHLVSSRLFAPHVSTSSPPLTWELPRFVIRTCLFLLASTPLNILEFIYQSSAEYDCLLELIAITGAPFLLTFSRFCLSCTCDTESSPIAHSI